MSSQNTPLHQHLINMTRIVENWYMIHVPHSLILSHSILQTHQIEMNLLPGSLVSVLTLILSLIPAFPALSLFSLSQLFKLTEPLDSMHACTNVRYALRH